MTNTEFTKSFNQIENLLYGFALKLTRNQEDAKDLIQETSWRAYKNIEKFRMGTYFKAWMTTIMRNTFINNYRKNKKRKTLEKPVDDFLFAVESNTISSGAESSLMVEEVKSAITDMSDNYSVPFDMFCQGYQYMEIAEHLDIPIGTVKSRIHFARKKLRDTIEEMYGNANVRTAK